MELPYYIYGDDTIDQANLAIHLKRSRPQWQSQGAGHPSLFCYPTEHLVSQGLSGSAIDKYVCCDVTSADFYDSSLASQLAGSIVGNGTGEYDTPQTTVPQESQERNFMSGRLSPRQESPSLSPEQCYSAPLIAGDSVSLGPMETNFTGYFDDETMLLHPHYMDWISTNQSDITGSSLQPNFAQHDFIDKDWPSTISKWQSESAQRRQLYDSNFTNSAVFAVNHSIANDLSAYTEAGNPCNSSQILEPPQDVTSGTVAENQAMFPLSPAESPAITRPSVYVDEKLEKTSDMHEPDMHEPLEAAKAAETRSRTPRKTARDRKGTSSSHAPNPRVLAVKKKRNKPGGGLMMVQALNGKRIQPRLQLTEVEKRHKSRVREIGACFPCKLSGKRKRYAGLTWQPCWVPTRFGLFEAFIKQSGIALPLEVHLINQCLALTIVLGIPEVHFRAQWEILLSYASTVACELGKVILLADSGVIYDNSGTTIGILKKLRNGSRTLMFIAMPSFLQYCGGIDAMDVIAFLAIKALNNKISHDEMCFENIGPIHVLWEVGVNLLNSSAPGLITTKAHLVKLCLRFSVWILSTFHKPYIDMFNFASREERRDTIEVYAPEVQIWAAIDLIEQDLVRSLGNAKGKKPILPCVFVCFCLVFTSLGPLIEGDSALQNEHFQNQLREAIYSLHKIFVLSSISEAVFANTRHFESADQRSYGIVREGLKEYEQALDVMLNAMQPEDKNSPKYHTRSRSLMEGVYIHRLVNASKNHPPALTSLSTRLDSQT
ncbi:hypothetical protein BX600DRAFT_443241 [Xylariales sp. PMI_506]|nr:hypothetical protein BX600DRAFT_443241 [Xylariales sp. PMI_506]